METFADKVLNFYSKLDLSLAVPDVSVMNPYQNPGTFQLVTEFFKKFYTDNRPRVYIFGINPGRFGAGLTGISFTDPVNLAFECGIPNNLEQKHELSSQFIYQVIRDYSGVEAFFGKFFVTALSPLGFIKEGKNLNYYDLPQLRKEVFPFMIECTRRQMSFGANPNFAICLGGDKNFKYLTAINLELKLFKRVIPLEHPRFIMQYKRSSIGVFSEKYLNALKNCE